MYFLLDLPVILAFRQRDWEAWSRLGACYLTEPSLKEMEFLTHRSMDKTTEQAAREFTTFYSHSDWKLASAPMAHPALHPSSGQAISQRARLLLSLSHCAYGASQHYPNQLVIAVSHDQRFVARIQQLNVVNLCAISGPALKQWSRFGERPETVTQAQRRLEGRGVVSPVQRPTRQPDEPTPSVLPITQSSPSKRPDPHASMPARKTIVVSHRLSSQAQRTSKSQSRFQYVSPYPPMLAQIIHLGLALLAFLIGIGLLLKLFAPNTFEQIWQRIPLEGQVQNQGR